MINYNIMQDSIDYYSQFGFQRIEVPWVVSEEIDSITRPSDRNPFVIQGKELNLVASGEQSFLQLYHDGKLQHGRFQTITPCWRDEKVDVLHKKYFIKNELIDTENVSDSNLLSIIEIALNFFKKYLPQAYVLKTDIGYDIMHKDIELGSYGIRECSFLKWIYATGCAEPRLSIALNDI